jgi:hypothetical protein
MHLPHALPVGHQPYGLCARSPGTAGRPLSAEKDSQHFDGWPFHLVPYCEATTADRVPPFKVTNSGISVLLFSTRRAIFVSLSVHSFSPRTSCHAPAMDHRSQRAVQWPSVVL